MAGTWLSPLAYASESTHTTMCISPSVRPKITDTKYESFRMWVGAILDRGLFHALFSIILTHKSRHCSSCRRWGPAEIKKHTPNRRVLCAYEQYISRRPPKVCPPINEPNKYHQEGVKTLFSLPATTRIEKLQKRSIFPGFYNLRKFVTSPHVKVILWYINPYR